MGKIAIISDVHSNSMALMRVLEDAKKQGCNRVICLGDIVGYGPDPIECTDLLKQCTDVTLLMGNHDAALCGKLSIDWFSPTAAEGVRRQSRILTDDHKQWLSAFPYTYEQKFSSGLHAYFGHGAYLPQRMWDGEEERFPYLMGFILERENVDYMRKHGKNNVLFVGHTHCRRIVKIDEKYKKNEDFNKYFSDVSDIADDEKVDLSKGNAIINVGSVGYPRIEPFTSYVVFDTVSKQAAFRKLRFQFREYVERMTHCGIRIPSWMDRWYDEKKDKYVDED